MYKMFKSSGGIVKHIFYFLEEKKLLLTLYMTRISQYAFAEYFYMK